MQLINIDLKNIALRLATGNSLWLQDLDEDGKPSLDDNGNPVNIKGYVYIRDGEEVTICITRTYKPVNEFDNEEEMDSYIKNNLVSEFSKEAFTEYLLNGDAVLELSLDALVIA